MEAESKEPQLAASEEEEHCHKADLWYGALSRVTSPQGGEDRKALSSQPDLCTTDPLNCSYLCARYWSGSRSHSQGRGIPLAQWGEERDHIGPNPSGYRGAIEPANRSLDISLASAPARWSLEKEKRLMDPGAERPPPLTKYFLPRFWKCLFFFLLETSKGPFWST